MAQALTKIPTLSSIREKYPNVKSFLFDMDGTIFDTESYHAKALIEIGIEFKINPPHSPQDLHRLMLGKADHLVYEIAKSWENFPTQWSAKDFVETKNNKLIEILLNTHHSKYFSPEMKDLLHKIKDDDFFLGLVTSSEKVITQALLKHAQLENIFQIELTRDDCPKHKPDPWPYLKAIELAKIPAQETIIFEDSEVGLSAAKKSGAEVIKAQWYQGFKI